MARSKLTEEVKTKLIECFKNEMKDEDILKLFDISKTTLLLFKTSSGFRQKRNTRTNQKEYQKNGTRYCPRCNIVKSIDEFHSNTKGMCKSCKNTKGKTYFQNTMNKFYSSIEGVLHKKLQNIKLKIHTRSFPRDITITIPYLVDMYNHQNGKCYYSGLDMTLDRSDLYTVSIDRIDSSKGYEIGNVVLCCSTFNMMKLRHSPEKFIELCKAVADHNSS